MLLEKFRRYIKEQFHLHPNTKLILAVSGGVDSVVLTDLVSKSGFDFVIAHCNFKLRGDESSRDEMFVRSLEGKYDKQVLVKTFDTEKYSVENKISIQEAARALRYEWFDELVSSEWSVVSNKENIHSSFAIYLATAHHANDNIETLLINFFRGTGISGLHGIPSRQGKIIRPLLFAKREEILAYAKENNLNWVEDSSNASDKYTRNFFRHQIIPAIKEVYPNVENNLLHNIERLKDAEVLYQQAIQLHLKKLCEQKQNEIHIPVLKLKKAEPLNTILWEIIRQYDFHAAQVEEVKKLFDAENGSYIVSVSHRIIKNRNWFIIAPLETQQAQNILIEESDKKIKFENGILELEKLQTANLPTGQAGYKLQTDNNVASLDAKEIKFPLLLRKWKQGDYFYPLGMKNLPAGRQGKKKLSKFFIDQKLSKTEKEKVWVIEMNKKILWIIGYRIDERFKITSSTKEVLRLTWKK
jgi:tRNA(Ile)-lysidine synthase